MHQPSTVTQFRWDNREGCHKYVTTRPQEYDALGPHFVSSKEGIRPMQP